MKIDIHREDGVAVLNVIGSLDLYSARHFEAYFHEQVECKTPVIILMMNECTYVDSSGIYSLMWCRNTASANKIEMMLCDVHENVSRIFKLAGINKFITIISKRELLKKFAFTDPSEARKVSAGRDNSSAAFVLNTHR